MGQVVFLLESAVIGGLFLITAFSRRCKSKHLNEFTAGNFRDLWEMRPTSSLSKFDILSVCCIPNER